MPQRFKSAGLLASLAVVLMVLLMGCKLLVSQDTLAPTRQDVTVVVTPTHSPIQTATAPDQTLAPDCELNLSPVPAATQASRPVHYTFEPPQLLLAGDDLYELAGWLPDNRRLLLTKEVRGTLIQQIVTLDIQTKALKVYGERPQQPNAPPVWLEAQQAVAYTSRTEQSNITGQSRHQLLISKGEGRVEKVIDNLAAPYIASAQGGKQVLLLGGEQGEWPRSYAPRTRTFRDWPYALLATIRPDGREANMFRILPYQIAMQRGGDQVAFYGSNGLYVADLAKQTACYLALGEGRGEPQFPLWPTYAQWSPDGQTVAMLTTSENYEPFYRYLDLTLLNVQTGEVRTVRPTTAKTTGQTAGGRYVTGVSWSPDSKVLIATALVGDDGVYTYDGLFTVTTDGSMRRILPSYEGAGFPQIEWSPDGQLIAVGCPTIDEDRLCLITVKHQPAATGK